MYSLVILKGKKVRVLSQKQPNGDLNILIHNENISEVLEAFVLKNAGEKKFHADVRKKYKQWKRNPPLTWTGEAGRKPARTKPFFTGRRMKKPTGRGIFKSFPHLHPSVRGNPSSKTPLERWLKRPVSVTKRALKRIKESKYTIRSRKAKLSEKQIKSEKEKFNRLFSRKGNYLYRKNPVYNKPVEIYDKILAIEAVKGKQSHWKNQPFVHKFGRSKSKIYGMPDGSLRIKGSKRLWAKKRYN